MDWLDPDKHALRQADICVQYIDDHVKQGIAGGQHLKGK